MTVFVLDVLPVEASQPVALGQVSASNLDGALLAFSADDAQLPDGTGTTLFMGEGHPSAAPYDPPDGQELVQMFHFGPDGTTFANPARLTLPNTLELAPGERIEFHSFNESTLLWEKAAVLEVNAEGTKLETIEGGISHFSAGGIFQPEGSLPEYTVTGLVQDDLDQFLSNIHVFAIGARGRMLADDTNAQGSYTISGIRVSCHKSPYLTVAASRSGTFLDDTLTSVVAEVTDDPSQTVQAPVLILPNNVSKGSVRGKALSPLGTPVEGACVTIYPSIGTDISTWTLSENDEEEDDEEENDPGTFQFDIVPAGPARVTITHDVLRLFKEIPGEVPEDNEWYLGDVILDEVADTQPPNVLWSMPVDGQENLYHLSELRVVFNETLAPASLQATLKRTLTNEAVSGSATLENGTTVVFTPDVSFEDGRAYTFTLGAGLADLSGNTLGEEYVLQFQMVAPTCPDTECTYGAFDWILESCVATPKAEGIPCRNANGTCNNSGECVCNNAFMTADCSACQDGYIDFPDCRDNPCDPDPCNGHGNCDENDGSCTCDNAFMTEDCSTCLDGYEGWPDCEVPCAPKTCQDLGYECGTWSDGCGGNTEPCGTCEFGFACHETFGQCNIDCPGGVTARRIDEAYFPGTTQAVYGEDGYLYISQGSVLKIYREIDDQLEIVNEVHLASTIMDIFVVSGWVYAALPAKGLAMLDVSDPVSPSIPVYKDLDGWTNGVFVSGNFAYVADGWLGLAIIDITDQMNPGDPVYMRTIYAMDVFVSGNYTYVADDEYGLAIIDVSDPINPGEPVYRNTNGSALGVFVSGNYAYVADHEYGLAVIDVSNPINPGEPVYRDTNGYAESVFISGTHAYVADYNHGLAIIDISNPTNPGEPVNKFLKEASYDIFVSEDSAYLAGGDSGLAVIDIRDPANPEEPWYIETMGSASTIFISGNYAYVADYHSGLKIIDMSDPTNPGEPLYWDKSDFPRGFFISGNYAYRIRGAGLSIIEIIDPLQFGEPISSRGINGIPDKVFVSGNYAYVTFLSGLAIIDVTDPSYPGEPVYISTGGVQDVFVANYHAYVVGGEYGLAIIDVSDPINPGEPVYRNTNGSALGVFVSGNYAYVADHEYGLAVIDVSNPANPGEPVYKETNGSASGVFISGTHAYIADGYSGFALIDISDPTNPGEPVTFETTGSANEVFVSGSYVWVAESSNGMETFELRCLGTCTPDPCHGHGTCTIVDDDAACTCNQGFGGDWCEQCAEGYEGYPDCEISILIPEFVPITAGTFWMGSPDGDCPVGYPGVCNYELGREPIEANEELHEVALTYDFDLMTHELTQGEWLALMAWNPSNFSAAGSGVTCGNNCPVENISWFDVLAYANELSLEAGFMGCYVFSNVECEDSSLHGNDYMACMNATQGGIDSATIVLADGANKPQECKGYRLPTEAEWEYSIRTGNQYTAFYQSDGNDGTITYTGRNPVDPNLDQIGWFGGNNDPYSTKPIGNKEPNDWGLYDISGNVWEWTWDKYCRDNTGYGSDPDGGNCESLFRVMRGGSWGNDAFFCRSATRNKYLQDFRNASIGFRLARTLHPESCIPGLCSNHGTCNDTNGYALCDCNTGYDGADCSVCAPHYAGYPDCQWDGTFPEGYCDFNQCWPVPPTGQTACYNNSESIECSTIGGSEPPDCDTAYQSCTGLPDSPSDACFCGQDAQYADNARTFTCYNAAGIETPCINLSTASEDEVVVDSLTGLMWQRWLPETYEGCTGGDPVGSRCEWQQAIDYCATLNEGEGYGGFTDWRLPAYHELQSIVDYGRYLPAIDNTAFPGTPLSMFWSSSSRANSTNYAWYVSFDNGYVNDYSKTNNYYARCVCAGPEDSVIGSLDHLILSEPVTDEPVVTDLVTGLIWQKEHVTDKSWEEALAYCQELNYANETDWRLPNVNELASLVNIEVSYPSSDFPDMPSNWFWSSSSHASNAGSAWLVNFLNGFVSNYLKTNNYDARCVCAGP